MVGDLPDFLIRAREAVTAGRLDEARGLLSPGRLREVRATARDDGSGAGLLLVVADLLYETHLAGQAESWYRRLLEIAAHPHACHRLAQICSRDTSRLAEAATYSRKALETQPDNAAFRCILARDLIQCGRTQEGVDLLAQAADLSPQRPDVRSSHLWYLHYLPAETRESLSQGYRRWGRDFAPVGRARTHHANVPDPDRRLRIGYLSPDFRRHPVSLSFEPILDGHDRTAVEVFGYGHVACPDAVTARLRQKFDVYRPVWGQDAEAVARQIEHDRIDVLVALAGHCTGHRLDVLALKPSPIQVDVGGIDTTGMEQVDYRITDPILDPPEAVPFYTEQLVHLSGGCVSFRPPQESPMVGALPAQANGFVTFGSFNQHPKISGVTLSLWSEIIRSVPDSQMILQFPAGQDAGVREHLWREFERRGVARNRVTLCGELPYLEHLELMGQVDLALDTYPFNGCMTSLEGLWMGVPVVTLTGQTCVSRVGLDILTRLGLEVFAASDPRQVVVKACAFARQGRDLAAIRSSLRALMLQSPLCQPRRMAGDLEQAYRRMWRRWCEGQGTHHESPVHKEDRTVLLGSPGAPVAIAVEAAHDAAIAPPSCELEGTLAPGHAPVTAEDFHRLAQAVAQDDRRLSEAVDLERRAVDLDPGHALHCRGLGLLLMRVGRVEEAVQWLRRAVDLDPADPIHEVVLSGQLTYLPEAGEEDLARGPRRWAQGFAPADRARRHWLAAADPDRPLRIGYLCSDFRAHASMANFEAALVARDRGAFEVYGYGSVARPDHVTGRIAGRFDLYRDVLRLSDDQVAACVEADGVDILVEIGGLCEGHRLGVLAARPAPIQVDYGAVGTTGLVQIDYRLTDEILDPPHLARAYAERSVYLPGGLVGYTPSPAPPVPVLPARRNGFVTFGCFNNNTKINRFTLDLWAQILRAVPGSRLVLACQVGGDPRARAMYREALEQLGVEPARVQIGGRVPSHLRYLAALGQIDIALDTYPYQGCITTLDGLWMGVPVISLAGRTYVSRVSLTLLSRIGLAEWVACDGSGYVSRAVDLAGDLDRLAGLRLDLRTRLQASCVCDTRRFARDLEAAYRWMWREGCRLAACHDGRAAGRDTGVASERREPCPAGQA